MTKKTSIRAKAVTQGDLSKRERTFVRELIETGQGRRGAAVDAVIAAGYTSNRNAARVRAYELLHSSHILEALREESTRRLHAGAALATSVLLDLAASATSEQVRLAASKELLDRSIGPIPSRASVQVGVQIDNSAEALLEALENYKAGRPVEFTDGTIIQAEFSEVDEDKPSRLSLSETHSASNP